MKTIVQKIGGFRNITGDGNKSKTYVYVGIQAEGSETVYLKQYILSKHTVDGWEVVKSFKEMKLFKNEIHIRLDTLYAALKMLNIYAPEIYNRIRKHLNINS